MKLAHYDNFPPFSYCNRGEPKGLAIDILLQVFKELNLKVIFIPTSMEKVKNFLESKKVDGIAFSAINPERRKIYDFSDPYLVSGGALFVRSPNLANKGLKGFEGKTVVTPKTGPLTGYIQKRFQKVELLLVKDYLLSLKAVLDGKAEAAALNIHVGSHLANQLFPGKFILPKKVSFKTPVAIAVSKSGQASFLKKFNESLKKIKKSGTNKKIFPSIQGLPK
jgi:ABC-type amino acid transport substrate-binding protein